MKRHGVTLPDLSRWMYWSRNIDADAVDAIYDEITVLLRKSQREKILLWVGSGGGDPGMAIAFYEWVKLVRVNLITIGMGEVASGGVTIFMAGKERYVLPRTHFYFHYCSAGSIGEVSTVEADGRLKVLDYESQIMREIVCEQTGVDPKIIKGFVRNASMVHAADVVRHGLAHQIIAAPEELQQTIRKSSRYVRTPNLKLVGGRR
jgi:ATP-dependent Clp protease, protease subunit